MIDSCSSGAEAEAEARTEEVEEVEEVSEEALTMVGRGETNSIEGAGEEEVRCIKKVMQVGR